MWKLKVLIQFALGHVPGGENLNFLLQKLAGSHSSRKIRQRLGELVAEISHLHRQIDLRDKTVLEIGTGWEAINALLLFFFGAGRIYTYDHVRHVRFALVRRVLEQFEMMLPELATKANVPDEDFRRRLARLRDSRDLKTLFEAAGIVYCAPSDACRTGIPDRSVDLIYSYDVLEHVPEQTLQCLTREAKRVLTGGGHAFHVISEGDHYAGVSAALPRVNFLQYPEWLWRLLVQNDISYHNRLREKEFLEIFASHEFQIDRIESQVEDRDIAAVGRMRIDRRFAGMTNEELAVNRTILLLSIQDSTSTRPA